MTTLITMFRRESGAMSLEVTEFANEKEAETAAARVRADNKNCTTMFVNERVIVNLSQLLSTGRLTCDTCTDPDYPGYDIEFISNQETEGTAPRVLIEAQDNGESVRTYIWNDPESEEPTARTLIVKNK